MNERRKSRQIYFRRSGHDNFSERTRWLDIWARHSHHVCYCCDCNSNRPTHWSRYCLQQTVAPALVTQRSWHLLTYSVTDCDWMTYECMNEWMNEWMRHLTVIRSLLRYIRWRWRLAIMRVDLSPRLGGGHTVANQLYCPPLIHLHPPRNGVRSHSRCGTESWSELELAFHLTVTLLIRLQGLNDSLH